MFSRANATTLLFDFNAESKITDGVAMSTAGKCGNLGNSGTDFAPVDGNQPVRRNHEGQSQVFLTHQMQIWSCSLERSDFDPE